MRGAIVLLAGLVLAAVAEAAPPAVTAAACVRIPMWIAPTLFNSHGFGTTVLVHS